MGHPQDVIFRRPKYVGKGSPQDAGRGRPLALHRGPYGDVHRTSFGNVLRTSPGRNFAECVILVSYFQKKEMTKNNSENMRKELFKKS